MARTIQQIYDAMALEKSQLSELSALQPNIDTSQSLLTQLTTTSRVAHWRLMLWLVATAIWVHEKLWDTFRAEVDEVAKGSIIGTLRWYVAKARAYQHGYDLDIIDNVPGYAVDVPAARIVAQAAGRDTSGHVVLKVAKAPSGVLQPLSAPELAGFVEYIDRIKMAGTVISILSAEPDLVRITATVYYNPLVLASNGSLLTDASVFPVEDAINAYLATLPFNGQMSITSLTDAMQAAEGVVNPQVVAVQAKYLTYAFAAVTQFYDSYAGYLVVDPDAPLATTITYVPYVV